MFSSCAGASADFWGPFLQACAWTRIVWDDHPKIWRYHPNSGIVAKKMLGLLTARRSKKKMFTRQSLPETPGRARIVSGRARIVYPIAFSHNPSTIPTKNLHVFFTILLSSHAKFHMASWTNNPTIIPTAGSKLYALTSEASLAVSEKINDNNPNVIPPCAVGKAIFVHNPRGIPRSPGSSKKKT